jgi:ferredoxin
MVKKVIVDQKLCIGCGLCAVINPKIFKMGKNGKSMVMKEISVLDSKTKEAISSCPVKAITFK